MRRKRLGRGLGSVMLAGAIAIGVSGCDYWPPALQAQIEQLRAEAQAAATERGRTESQLTQATKMRDELQARVNELANQNRDLTAKVTGLEQSLAAEREKGAKMAKPGKKAAHAKAGVKKSAKGGKKTTAKK